MNIDKELHTILESLKTLECDDITYTISNFNGETKSIKAEKKLSVLLSDFTLDRLSKFITNVKYGDISFFRNKNSENIDILIATSKRDPKGTNNAQ